MTPEKRLNYVIAAIFLIVGVIATVNTIRLNSYIRETLPRDTAQEACQLATLQSLRVWAVARGQIEDAKAARDVALNPLFEALIRGEQVPPDTAAAVQRELHNVDMVRNSMDDMLAASPLPDCKLVPAQQ